MKRALAVTLAFSCAHAPLPVTPEPPPTISAEVVAAELGDAGVGADVLKAWDLLDAGTDAPTVGAVRGAALLPSGWRAFGPSCVVAAPRCVAAGAKLAGDNAKVEELERVPPGVRPQIVSALVGFALGLAAGAAAGVLVYGLVKR